MNNMTKILTGGAVALVAVLAFVFGQNITFKQSEIAAATAKAGAVQEIQKNQAQGAVTNAPGAPFLPPVPAPPAPYKKVGCIDKNACDYDKDAELKGNCTYAVYDYTVASRDSKNCKLGVDKSKLQKIPRHLPSDPFVPPANPGKCSVGNELSALFNVHLYIWTVAADGSLASESTVFAGISSAIGQTLPGGGSREDQGKNACATKKMIEDKPTGDAARAEQEKLKKIFFDNLGNNKVPNN